MGPSRLGYGTVHHFPVALCWMIGCLHHPNLQRSWRCFCTTSSLWHWKCHINSTAKEVEQRQLTHRFSNPFVEFWFAYSISRYKVRPERHCLYGTLISLGSTLAQRLSGGLCLAKPSAVSTGNVEVSISSKGSGVWTLINLAEDKDWRHLFMLNLEARGISSFQAGFAHKLWSWIGTSKTSWLTQVELAPDLRGECVSLFAPQQLGNARKAWQILLDFDTSWSIWVI